MAKDKKQKENKKDDNMLEYIPCIKHTDYEIKNNKVYLIFYHKKPIEKFLRWLVKKPYKTDLELDEFGSFVWNSLDGKRNIYEVGQLLSKRFGDKCNPLYDRLIMFLRHLYAKGWIVFKKSETQI